MHEIRFTFKETRPRTKWGARKQTCKEEGVPYHLITLGCGRHACAQTDEERIRCLNHEIMHCVLEDIIGEKASIGWDNIIKSKYDKNYGWKNIVGKYLSDIYCDEGE